MNFNWPWSPVQDLPQLKEVLYSDLKVFIEGGHVLSCSAVINDEQEMTVPYQGFHDWMRTEGSTISSMYVSLQKSGFLAIRQKIASYSISVRIAYE